MSDVSQIDHAMAVASVAGATAGALINRTDSTWRKVADGMAGAMVGVILGPAAADMAGAINEHFRMGVGFLVGAGGLVVFTGFMDYVKGASFAQWLERWFPKGPVAKS